MDSVLWERKGIRWTLIFVVSLGMLQISQVASFVRLSTQTTRTQHFTFDNHHVSSFLPTNIVRKIKVFCPIGTACGIRQESLMLQMAKRKPSMAEKRKRRANKVPANQSMQDLPPCKLDFKSTGTIKPTQSGLSRENSVEASTATTTTPGLDASKKITDPKVAGQRAEQLLKAQRDSVKMLTYVRERVEQLPSTSIAAALKENGFYIMDDFLKDESVIDNLEQEGMSMLTHMEQDITIFGSGEYIASIEGGDKQYTKCPRLVEFVVSATKHLPKLLEDMLFLDGNVCMATLRTFDRKTFKAALALTGVGDADDEEKTIQEFSQQRPIGIVAGEEDDRRAISLFYYPVPRTWDGICGGGLEIFGNTEDSSMQNEVAVKRDRLVVVKSDSCHFRRMPWRGNDNGNEIGSCVELHLVRKK